MYDLCETVDLFKQETNTTKTKKTRHFMRGHAR